MIRAKISRWSSFCVLSLSIAIPVMIRVVEAEAASWFTLIKKEWKGEHLQPWLTMEKYQLFKFKSGSQMKCQQKQLFQWRSDETRERSPPTS